jgi:hypothetical protein
MFADASKLSDQEIERELSEVARKVRQALDHGDRIGELSARLWRLRAEAQFRERRRGC